MSGSKPVFRAFRQPAAMAAIVTAGLLVGACGGGGGGGGSNTPPPGGNNDPIQPTLASIQEKVFTPICTACHAGAAAPQGLRLEAGMSHAMLVGVASVEVPELFRVEAGNPDDSYIIHKLEGTQTFGDRMPQGGPYLSQTTIDAIRQWITDGAMNSGGDGTGDGEPSYKGMAHLTDGWPVAGSSLPAPPKRIMLVADAELDTSMLHAGSVQVLKIDDVDGLTQKPRQITAAELMVTSLSPTVISLRVPETEWTPGRYEIRVAGTGAFAVLDRAGQRIDGDADGQPGGDFVMQFDVEAVQ